jgi:predicted enzyme related to lactoylglutathione lyase
MSSPRQRFRAAYLPVLCSAVLCAAGIAGAQAATNPFQLPSLLPAASGEHHVGKVIWVDLVTPDIARAEQFYTGLFGWSFEKVAGDPNYEIASVGGQMVGGLYQKAAPAGQSRQPAWLTFIAVRDVEAARRLALAHGAKVLSATRDYPQRGRQAVLSDPDGAVFALLASSSGDPPDAMAAPGEWIWSSLMVRDAGHEAGFYQTVFGYDVFDLPSDGALQHLVLSSDDFARAGISTLPSDAVRRHPHWLNFVRVTDAADVASRAVSLGGRVLVEPRMDRHGGRLAVLADPTGAPFGVMEWSENATQQEPK